MIARAILIVAVFAPVNLWAGDLMTAPPEKTDPQTRYVFYLHGQIVQDVGPRPTHPRYGLYDYPLILNTLAQDEITVISERRAPGTGAGNYADRIAGQVKELLAAGAKPENVTVVGFSAGGVIAILTSSRLRATGINFVFLAACSGWMKNAPDIRLHGHVLSVFEESDQTYSCEELARRTPAPESFEEFSINTGKEHGAFYLPNDAWLKPVIAWIRR